jgi:hypothetical protein
MGRWEASRDRTPTTLGNGVYKSGIAKTAPKTQKEGSYGPKNALFHVAACAFVRIRAQNCLFWASFAEKITPMEEYARKYQ